MKELRITPKTKIHELLEAYPQLEEVLIRSAPQFKKLQNPILRKTIARVTSLSQAAIVGGVNVEELIRSLREAAGQEGGGESENESPDYVYVQPKWFSPGAVAETIHIDEMLNRGEQPVHEVLSVLKKMKSEQILEVEAPFVPAPLIDKALGLGYAHWIMKITDQECLVYFKREEPGPGNPVQK
ncbi:MAG: DUF1858 domain-containing protein [Bacteroidales bacterium]